MIFTDQTGKKIELSNKPGKIISLVPSQSEFLWDIGLQNELAGITKFCIHPREMFQSVTRVGGTKKLHLEKIHSIHPGLIIGNKEENEKEQIEQLQKEYKVWMSDIFTLEDAFDMMKQLGEITQREEQANTIAEKIRNNFSLLPHAEFGSALYLIWKNPYMAAGKNTFIDEMMARCGFLNVLKEKRYPEISEEYISELKPEFILLSSEPYPFAEKHISGLQKISPASKIIVVDGEMFSWYGSRLLYAADYFISLRKQL
ncbi:MAG: ABC transporter substrate-binding protein [Bacteroidota bacterium]